MPKINIQSALMSGTGTFTVTDQGRLRTAMTAPSAPRSSYQVTAANGGISTRSIKVGGWPWLMKGESALLEARDVKPFQVQPPPEGTAVGILRALSCNLTSEDGDLLGETPTPGITVYAETGEFLFTTLANSVSVKKVEEPKPVNGSNPVTQDTIDQSPGSITARNVIGMREDATLLKVKSKLVHNDTLTPVVEGDGFWSAATWPTGPLNEDTRLKVVINSEQRTTISGAVFVTPFGSFSLGLEVSHVDQPPASAPVSFEWLTDFAPLPYYDTSGFSTVDVTYFSAVLGTSGYVFKKGAGAVFEVEYLVYDSKDTLLSSGASASFQGGSKYRIKLSGTAQGPIEVSQITAEVSRNGKPPVEPPPPVGGAEFVDVGVGLIGGYFGMAYVPNGVRRIFRHPMMEPGATCTTDGGVYCAWESANFLLLPPNTRYVQWKAGGGSTPSSPPRTDLKTSYTWGACQISQTQQVPDEVTGNFKSQAMRSYTPNIQVSIGGLDGTLDLTSAGGLSATFTGSFDQVTGGMPQIEGNDFVITLDGVTIEWGRVVSYHVTSNDEGSVVEVSAVDILDYHNVDTALIYNNDSQSVSDPMKDLAGFAMEIAGRAGIPLYGTGELQLLTNADADTEGDDPYVVFGNTVTQELELVANAGLCTVVTDAPTQTVRFMGLGALVGGSGGGGTPPANGEKSCAFVGRGYNLAEGYALVEVTGVSNTVFMSTKDATVPFIRIGSNGMEDDNAVKVLKHSGDAGFSLLNGFYDSKDVSDWWPDQGTKDKTSINGSLWVEFTRRSGSEAVLYPVPLKYNLPKDMSKEAADAYLARFANGGRLKLGDPGAPELNKTAEAGEDPREVYWVEYKHPFPGASGPDDSWKVSDVTPHKGNFRIDEIEFLVESVEQMKARFPSSADSIPKGLGPCVTAFRVHVKDEGLFGYSAYFRIGFHGRVLDESSVSLLAFNCPATVDPGATKLPNKKVTIQNPFIVQERPKDGESGGEFKPENSKAFAHGVKLANYLTQWEAVKRYAGEVKVLGGHVGRIGGYIEGQRIIDQPTAQIVPGEACWTIFKTSSR